MAIGSSSLCSRRSLGSRYACVSQASWVAYCSTQAGTEIDVKERLRRKLELLTLEIVLLLVLTQPKFEVSWKRRRIDLVILHLDLGSRTAHWVLRWRLLLYEDSPCVMNLLCWIVKPWCLLRQAGVVLTTSEDVDLQRALLKSFVSVLLL